MVARGGERWPLLETEPRSGKAGATKRPRTEPNNTWSPRPHRGQVLPSGTLAHPTPLTSVFHGQPVRVRALGSLDVHRCDQWPPSPTVRRQPQATDRLLPLVLSGTVRPPTFCYACLVPNPDYDPGVSVGAGSRSNSKFGLFVDA